MLADPVSAANGVPIAEHATPTPKDKVGLLVQHAQAYTQTSIELLKLKSVAALTTVVNDLIKRACAVLAFSVAGLLLTIGAAQWLGELLGRTYYGYFVDAGVYLLLGTANYLLLGRGAKPELTKLFDLNKPITQDHAETPHAN
jgi:hypothetical protein